MYSESALAATAGIRRKTAIQRGEIQGVPDTTLRARRNEWVKAGVFHQLMEDCLAFYHELIGLDLDDVAIDAAVLPHLAWDGGGFGHADLLELYRITIDGERDGTPVLLEDSAQVWTSAARWTGSAFGNSQATSA
mgnify:CR=1 FL=1